MKINAYSVLDNQVNAYLPPFYARTDGEAKRSFMQAVVTGSLKEHRQDYTLYHVGSFDDANAQFTPQHPHYLASGQEAYAAYEDMIRENRQRVEQHNLNKDAQTKAGD